MRREKGACARIVHSGDREPNGTGGEVPSDAREVLVERLRLGRDAARNDEKKSFKDPAPHPSTSFTADSGLNNTTGYWRATAPAGHQFTSLVTWISSLPSTSDIHSLSITSTTITVPLLVYTATVS